MSPPNLKAAIDRTLIAGGMMGTLMRSINWSETPLGDVATWEQSLCSAISILLASKTQICLFWGSELITIYNDAYCPILASKHPWALGRPAHQVWSETWNTLQPLLEGVLATGEAYWAEDQLFLINRKNYPEETYFDISYAPVRDETGEVGGVFCTVTENTERVHYDRQLQTLSLLVSETAQARTVEAAYQTTLQAIAKNSHDIPFAFLYRVEAENFQAIRVEPSGLEGVEPGTIPRLINLTEVSDSWHLGQAYQTRQAIVVERLDTYLTGLPRGAWNASPTAAWVVPLRLSGQSQTTEFLVLGISPHRNFDAAYRRFFKLIASHVAAAITNASAFQEERDRNATLTAINRAKTTFFNAVVSSVPDFIYTFDVSGQFTYANQPLLDLWQTPLDDLIGKGFSDLGYSPELVSQHHQQIQQVISTRQPVKAETPYTGPSGITRIYEYIFSPLFSAEGTVEAIVGTTRDITDRKQAEAALRKSEALSRDILESISDGFFALDEQWRFTYANKAAEKLSGYPTGGLIGKTFWEEFPDLAISESGKVHQRLMSEPIGQSAKAVYCYQERWYEIRSYAATNGMTIYFTDVTERIRAEADRNELLAEAQAAREQAERANRIKDEFLAVLSHELRTPLNPILGWAKLLKMGKLNPTRTIEAIDTIERNAKLQSQLIEDLLDVSRILRGKLVLNVSEVALVPMIRAALETVQLAAEAKDIHVLTTFELAEGRVSGDAGRLQQIIWNLLSNAVKFTPVAGRIEVRLTQVDRFAQIQIIDTGKGISADFLPHVFEHFRQEDGATTRKFGGLGLGLAIVRQLVELHGGTVTAASDGEDRGATFTVRLPLLLKPSPLTQQNDTVSDSFPETPLAGLKVMVVDDDADSRSFVTFVLEQAGANVMALTSAPEVLQSIQQDQPDLLVSDVGMPEMDGCMLIRAIRAEAPSGLQELAAIALTAYAGEANEQQVLQAGFQKHLTKPIEPIELIAVIRQLVQK
jgi:PAS domain S-box-containing protein